MDDLETTYTRTFKGVEQGSTRDDVIAALGEPSFVQQYQIMGYESWYYEDGFVRIDITGSVEKLAIKDAEFFSFIQEQYHPVPYEQTLLVRMRKRTEEFKKRQSQAR